MRWNQDKERENQEKIRDFQAKMTRSYAFKRAYAARRAWEFYNHPEVWTASLCFCSCGPSESMFRRSPYPCWRIRAFRESTGPWASRG